MRTIDKILTPRNCKYGAPMGRSDVIPQNFSIVDIGAAHKYLVIDGKSQPIFDCAVPMSPCGAYSKDGTYWGIGRQLRVKYTRDLQYIKFYRRGEE